MRTGGHMPSHVAVEIAAVLGRYMDVREVTSIWEIGSRDGQDARRLSQVFSGSVVHAFEPNPDTFDAVQAAAVTSHGAVVAHNVALCSESGPLVFHKICPSQTLTTWADGNPGASSLFPSNGAYDAIETYGQIRIQVAGVRADTLLETGIPAPQLIWMDVQGAEKLVLEGFGNHLAGVKAIFVELSLREIYEGQALAVEVIDLLSRDFYWHSNLRCGEWQFDALFIAKSVSSHRNLRIRDALLKKSLGTGVNAGIAYPLSPRGLLRPSRRVAGRVMRPMTRAALDSVRRVGSPALGTLTARTVEAITNSGVRRAPLVARMLVEATQSPDPLQYASKRPPIGLTIPCHPKDRELIRLVIAGAAANSCNEISAITLVTPDDAFHELRTAFPNVRVITDTDALGSRLQAAVDRYVPPRRRGWARQQLVKLKMSLEAPSAGTLIVDADTVLLHPRTWIDESGVQLLAISHEFHSPYADHAASVWGKAAVLTSLSFVTHYQIMQREILEEMFPEGESDLERWLSLADWTANAAMADYHSYGAWLVANAHHRLRFSQWANRGLSLRMRPPASLPAVEAVQRLAEAFPSCDSVSFHSHQRGI